jgi:hypothetical protein
MCKDMDLIHFALGRGWRWAAVYAVMNVGFHKRREVSLLVEELPGSEGAAKCMCVYKFCTYSL